AEEPGKVDARTLADLLRADLVAPSRRSTQRDKGIEKSDKTPNEPRQGQNQAEEPRPRPPRDRYELRFSGTDLFGKAGTEWLRTIKEELSWVDRLTLEANP
ncbi:MAG: hypothetical protein ACTSUQ_09155, partial [Candidatus Freyarchaeota archaeon]